ncbi:MAG: aromatic acid decarboxylase, partial [Candidatus Electrothrix sp. AR4]|nr:aromatic acid decarboxylase [Candidatus Electrothrix sp. AR4]
MKKNAASINKDARSRRIILGITGATGMLYVTALLNLMAEQKVEVHAVISDSGRKVLRLEQDTPPPN